MLAEHFVEKFPFFCHSGQEASDAWHILLTCCNIACLLLPVRNFQAGRAEGRRFGFYLECFREGLRFVVVQALTTGSWFGQILRNASLHVNFYPCSKPSNNIIHVLKWTACSKRIQVMQAYNASPLTEVC